MNRQQQVIFDKDSTDLLFVERKKVQEYKAYIDSIINGDFSSEFKKGHCYGQQTALDRLFGDKCLPDKEPSVQVEPRFKVGDKVRIKPNAKDFHNGYENGYAWLPIRDKYVGKVYRIKEIWERTYDYILDFPELISWAAIDLEPYTEPETKEEIDDILYEKDGISLEDESKIDEIMEEKELGKEDNFPTKELNRKALYDALCELETASIKVRKALISM